MPRQLAQLRRYLLSAFAGVAAAYVLFFMPLPYYILMPGTAEPVKPMVKLAKGEHNEQGAFMLTTVRGGDANVFNYVVARFHPYEELVKKEDMFGSETPQEYSQRQEYVMLTSQSDAMQAAYRKAGIPYEIAGDGVMVIRTIPGMPAEKVLRGGDYLLKVDQTTIHKAQELLDYLSGKKAGDTITFTYRRDKANLEAQLTLATLPQEKDERGNPLPQRAGLGIVPGDVQSVKAADPAHQFTVKTEDIGGPSAGLMFSLEMYAQLTGSDLTKGYRIAGTGTITPEGNVGPIGGIQHKVIAADREQAEIFFAPQDVYPKEGQKFEPVLNYSDAVERAKAIGSKMRIVSVATLDDAIKFLNELPPKSK
ncbi:SepM family pheromone-processing serine protease [Paenibacillus chartarius]|uniref:endopeptidase La n=1 Tax=Paenibacillus chartarius TaxID=747481 RepID=A0ABV6DNS5_9BACL